MSTPEPTASELITQTPERFIAAAEEAMARAKEAIARLKSAAPGKTAREVLATYDDGMAELSDAAARASVCQALSARATLRSLAGAGPGAESSVAKLLGVRNRQEASDLVLDLLGPKAVGPGADEEVFEALLTRCLSIAGGTTQVLRNVAAERILGLPR